MTTDPKQVCDKSRHDLKLNCVFRWTHATGFVVDVFQMYIPCHSKICHLTFLSFTNQNISCCHLFGEISKDCQVTMDNLQDIIFIRAFFKIRIKVIKSFLSYP